MPAPKGLGAMLADLHKAQKVCGHPAPIICLLAIALGAAPCSPRQGHGHATPQPE